MSYILSILSRKSLFSAIFLSFVSVGFTIEILVPQQVQEWRAAAVKFEKSGDFARAHTEYGKIRQAYRNTSYGLDTCIKDAQLYVKQKQFENLPPVVDQICTDFSKQPNLFSALSDLVEDCMYAGAYSTTESICTKVENDLSLNPRVTLTIGWRGMLYAHQGDFAGAKQMREVLLQTEDCIASDFLNGMCKIGLGFYYAGELDESLMSYRLGLERYPNHPQAVYLQYQVVKTLLAEDDMEGAESELQILLDEYGKRSQTPTLAFRLGNEYYKKWNLQGAINIYELLLAQYGNHKIAPKIRGMEIRSHEMLALGYFKKSRYQDAINIYEIMLSKFGDHEIAPKIRGMEIKSYEMLAKHYRRQKQTDDAIAAYEAIIERFPDDKYTPSIRDAIVETYADAGDLVKAREALKIDIENCPHRRELLRVMTRVAVDTVRAGDTGKAVELVDAIYNQEPDGADQLLFGYTTLARVYVHQNKDAEAEAAVNEALELFKDDPNALAYHLCGVGEEYYYLAQSAKQSGRLEKASAAYVKSISTLEKFMSTLPEMDQRERSNMLYVTGLSYWQLGEWFPAAAAFMDSVEANPGREFAGSIHWLISDCYENLKRDGVLTAEEADPMIEWGYQNLFEKYPGSRDVEYASLKLGKIHLARGEPVSACLYFNWFLDHAHANNGQIADIVRILERMEGCQ